MVYESGPREHWTAWQWRRRMREAIDKFQLKRSKLAFMSSPYSATIPVDTTLPLIHHLMLANAFDD